MNDNNIDTINNKIITNELFENIYNSLSNKIFNFALKMTGNKSIAEDIVQETFIKVYTNYKNFKGKSSLTTWIYTIAKNLCFKYYRKNKKSSFNSIENLTNKESTSINPNQFNEIELKSYIYQVKEGCLLGLLRCLSFYQRISFILNILFEFSINEVSSIINKSENSTRILIHRARNNIKTFLCNNCSLYDSKNKCKCENLVLFSLKQNWIEKYNPKVSHTSIVMELKEFKNEIFLYKSLNNYDIRQKILDILKQNKYFILSEKKVK